MLSEKTDQLTSWLKEGLPDLARFTPPAKVIDKRTASPWMEPDLETILQGEGIDTLLITGDETDAWVMGAVDRGSRLIVGRFVVCSSVDPTYDAMMVLDHSRFGTRIEPAPVAEILDAWPG
ncbi:hypothetical protein ASG52_23480 [Methylobacterium sp. Leaf456]|uniref:cysteine hydrolase family protein n=1 Tax=Methylobacterium sp. Leaf456 TaxID=1736382 RepID=UPI000700EBB0|nr:isochorismatase family protein [Methylobacterium sp. Leaf456]KQT57713.1 hypothetical protein ASG52_23480 [Methylobacterium sp. Leaf456]